jgi:hypothetical protein
MKHHAILLQESSILSGTYLTTEYNKTVSDNDIPDVDLSDTFAYFTLREIRDELRKIGFVEVFSTIQQPDEHGRIVNVPIGQVSILEMLLAGTAMITIFWFSLSGFPVRQSIYELRIKEE